MAGRTSQASARRGASSRSSATGRARQPAKKSTTAARRRPVKKSQPSGAVRAARSVWMGVARSVGWSVRAVGRQAATARDLDPEHRRDGLGLLLLGMAILSGVAVWFAGAGPLGAGLADGIRLFIGAIAAVLPLLLLIGAVRLMRDPGEPEHRGRGLVGWSSMLVATAALLHIGQDPVTNAERDYAGGLIGAAVGDLLQRAVTPWVAVPLLLLWLVFGLLVVTATPVNKVPQRLRELSARLLGRPPLQLYWKCPDRLGSGHCQGHSRARSREPDRPDGRSRSPPCSHRTCEEGLREGCSSEQRHRP